MGIIARDHHGEVKAAMCDVRDPSVTEAIAARRAVQFAHNMGVQSVELEGDAREIILALGSFAEADSSVGNLVLEARRMLETFPSWRVSHVRRDGNRTAHLMAKFLPLNSPNMCGLICALVGC